MLETRFITSKCEHCKNENSISLSYFVGPDYHFDDSVIAMCKTCNRDYVVTFDDTMIR